MVAVLSGRSTGGKGERSRFFQYEGEQDCSFEVELCFHHCLGLRLFLTVSVLLFQIIQPLLELDQNRSKLKLYIGHLTALCHDRDPLILRGLTPPASYHLDDDRAAWEKELQKMTQEQVSWWSEALNKGLNCWCLTDVLHQNPGKPFWRWWKQVAKIHSSADRRSQ